MESGCIAIKAGKASFPSSSLFSPINQQQQTGAGVYCWNYSYYTLCPAEKFPFKFQHSNMWTPWITLSKPLFLPFQSACQAIWGSLIYKTVTTEKIIYLSAFKTWIRAVSALLLLQLKCMLWNRLFPHLQSVLGTTRNGHISQFSCSEGMTPSSELEWGQIDLRQGIEEGSQVDNKEHLYLWHNLVPQIAYPFHPFSLLFQAILVL